MKNISTQDNRGKNDQFDSQVTRETIQPTLHLEEKRTIDKKSVLAHTHAQVVKDKQKKPPGNEAIAAANIIWGREKEIKLRNRSFP